MMEIYAKGLCKSYGDHAIISDFSYRFPQKGLVLISGPSGCGKTTLLRLLCGLEKPDSGSVGGFLGCAFVFQEYRLFPTLNALDNVRCVLPRKSTVPHRDAEALLRALGFSEDDMKKKIGALSGGMKQRVSIARALITDAPVLLLDEPTKELDAALRKKVFDILLEEAKERCVILCSHINEDLQSKDATHILLNTPAS